MIFAHPELMNTLEWRSGRPAILVIENPEWYLKIVRDLSCQNDGGEGECICSENNKSISFSKETILIRDIFAVDLNDRKIMKGVTQTLEQTAMDDFFVETIEIKGQLLRYAEKLCENIVEPVFAEQEIETAALLKAAGIHLENATDLLERLSDYIAAAQSFLKTKLVIIVGLRDFLTTEQFQLLCEETAAKQIPILFIEPRDFDYAGEKVKFIIDADLCEILID